MKSVWFTSDTHFDHESILQHQSNRGAAFDTVEEMNDVFIQNINACVKRDDLLVHCGDFAWRNSRLGHVRQRLNVRELWVTQGNHDANALRRYVSRMETQLTLKYHEHRFVMQHCPMFSWPGREHGTIHLYGHSHGASEDFLNEHFPDRRAMDVGIDYIYRGTSRWEPLHIDAVLGVLL